jgi:soluble lytic murein transglycosylase-like protein
MLDQEYAAIITKNTSFGLAEQIVKQIENSNNRSLLKTIQEIGRKPWMTDPRFLPTNIRYQSIGNVLDKISRFNSIIEEASSTYSIDKNLITAVIAQESAGNPLAQSPKGAKGLMQLIDSTAKAMGVSNVYNPRENILGGTKYLKQLLNKYGVNEILALASYNAGPGAVDKYNGVPPYKETQHYIRRISSFKDKLESKRTTESFNQNKD